MTVTDQKEEALIRRDGGSRARRCSRLVLLASVVALTVSFTTEKFGRNEQAIPRRAISVGGVRTISLKLDESAIESLRVHPRKTVRADLEIDGAQLGNVRVHLKGNSSFQPIDQKPSFTLTLADPGINGTSAEVHKFHLNNSVEDASLLDELIGTDLFRAAGVPAPAVAHALVQLNGRKLGVYVLKEAFSDEFVQRVFPGSAGTVYEPTQDGRMVSGRDGAVLDLRRAAMRIDRAAFRNFVAMELLIVHRDGYALSANNFRVFEDRGTLGLAFLPAGMDQLFGKADYPLNPKFGGELAREVFATASEREGLQRRMRELLPLLERGRLSCRIDSAVAELKPFLGRRQFNEVRAAADDLRERIARRYEFLEKNLGGSAAQGTLAVAAQPEHWETK